MKSLRYLRTMGLLLRLLSQSNAAVLPDEMGQLHGLPQKIGQHLTLYLNPAQDLFRSLHDHGGRQPCDIAAILRAKGLTPGGPIECAAQASIGQVFKVPTAELGDLAVKVKYAGIEQQLKADLRVIGMLAWLLRLLPVKSPVPAVINAFAGYLLQECDYRQEAARQQTVNQLFSRPGPQGISIPPVFSQLSDADVIVSSWQDGTKIDQALAEDAAARRSIFLKLVWFEFWTLIRLNLVHADPHPGNFLVRPTAQGEPELIILDFGSVLSQSEEETAILIRLLLGDFDEPGLLKALGRLGFDQGVLEEYRPVIGELITIVFEPFYCPGRYSFDSWRLNYKINQLLQSRNFARPFSFPPKLYLFLRMMQGLYYYARRYDIDLDWHQALREVLQRATLVAEE